MTFFSVFSLIIGISTFRATNKTDAVITALAFFSFSLLKIIPHIQSLYSSLTAMRANKRSLVEFIELLSLKNFYPITKQMMRFRIIFQKLLSIIMMLINSKKLKIT